MSSEARAVPRPPSAGHAEHPPARADRRVWAPAAGLRGPPPCRGPGGGRRPCGAGARRGCCRGRADTEARDALRLPLLSLLPPRPRSELSSRGGSVSSKFMTEASPAPSPLLRSAAPPAHVRPATAPRVPSPAANGPADPGDPATEGSCKGPGAAGAKVIGSDLPRSGDGGSSARLPRVCLSDGPRGLFSSLLCRHGALAPPGRAAPTRLHQPAMADLMRSSIPRLLPGETWGRPWWWELAKGDWTRMRAWETW